MATINAGDIFATLKLKDEMTGAAAGIAGKLAPIAAALGVVAAAAGIAHKALMAQAEAEGGVNKLNLALANQGRFSEAASQELQGFANQMQRTTVFSDDAVIAVEALLASFGLSTDQIQSATRAAADFAAATGTDLTTAANLLGKAYAGNTAALSRYGIVVSEEIPKGERFSAVMEQLNARFGGQAEAQIATYAGQLKVFENAVDDAWEALGKLLGTVGDFGSGGGPMSGAIDLVRRFSEFLGEDVVIALSEVRAKFAEFIGGIFDLNAKLADTLAKGAAFVGADEMAKRLREQGALAKLSAEDQRKLATEIRLAGDMASAASGKHQQVTNSLKPFKPVAEAAAKAAAEYAKKLKELRDRLSGAAVLSEIKMFNEAVAGQGVTAAILARARALAAEATQAGVVADGIAGALQVLANAPRPEIVGGESLATSLSAGTLAAAEYRAMLKAAIADNDEFEKSQREAAEAGDEHRESIARLQEKLGAMGGLVQGLSGTFEAMGGSARSTAGQIMGLAGQGIGNLSQGIENFGRRGEPVLQRAAAAATQFASTIRSAGQQGTAAGAAISGAMGGASAGAMFGPIGIGVGAVAGAIGGLIARSARLRAEANRLRKSFVEAAGGADALRIRAAEAGVSLDRLAAARDPTAAQRAIDEIRKAIETQDEAWKKVNEAMDRYGISIEQMGPKFRQQELDKQAIGLIEDYKLLTAAGAEWETVIAAMAPAMNAYVLTALAAGATVPEAMRAQIERMIQMGLLLDANGNAFTSVEQAGITFAETLSESLARLIARIDELVSAILGVQNQASKGVRIPVDIGETGGRGIRGEGDMAGGAGQEFAHGSGGFRDFGAGTPAVLHGVERVQTAAEAGSVVARLDPQDMDRLVRAIRDAVVMGA
jgi:hypothetical protein